MSTSTSTFELNNFSITVSLGERNIYIKFIDQINFTNFEANLNAKELGLNFELPEIYKLICDTFSKKKDYLVIVSIENSFMKLLFHILVSGFLTIKFQALLKEKILSNDGQLTINFNKLEQKYTLLLTKMNEMEAQMMRQNKEIISLVESVSNADVCLRNHQPVIVFPINSKEIEVSVDGHFNCSKIALFYNLEKLKFTTYCHANLTNIKNNNLKELTIVNTNNFQNLEGIKNLPNLEKLTLNSLCALNSVSEKISSITHKIKHIVITNCPSANAVELQNYCRINSIKLDIA